MIGKFKILILFSITLALMTSCGSPTGTSSASKFEGVPSGEIVPVEKRDSVLTGIGIAGKSKENVAAENEQKWWKQIISKINYRNCPGYEDEDRSAENAYFAFKPDGNLYVKKGESGTEKKYTAWKWTDDSKTAITLGMAPDVKFELTALNNEEVIYASLQPQQGGCEVITWEQFGEPLEITDEDGGAYSGPVTTFPADSARLVPTKVTLEWELQNIDVNPYDEISYSLYFSTISDSIPDAVFRDSIGVTSYEMKLGTHATYFWYVKATDENGNYLGESSTARFTTGGENFNTNIPMASIPPGDYRYGEQGALYNMDYGYEISTIEVSNGMYVELLNSLVGSNKIQINTGNVSADMEAALGGTVNAGHYILLDIAPASSSKIRFNEVNQTFSVKYGYVNHPVTHVTWHGALFFALEKGYKLPTKYEWERAARGNTDRLYPWGNEGISCVLANFLGCLTTGTDEVGGSDLSTGRSYFDLSNMAGNVGEWTETRDFSPVMYKFYAKGGSFRSKKSSNKLKVWGETSLPASGSFSDVGFRVVDPGNSQRDPS